MFPRLFDESLSFQDSFVPIYTFDNGTPGQGYYRIGVLLMLGGFVYWACTQPTEFDGFIQAQKTFIDDLYTGNLLSDVAHSPASHMERANKRVPSLEDLLKAMEADDKEKITSADEALKEELRATLNEEWAQANSASANSDGDDSGANSEGSRSSNSGTRSRNAEVGNDGETEDLDATSGGGASDGSQQHSEHKGNNDNDSSDGDGNTDTETEWTAPDYDEKREEE